MKLFAKSLMSIVLLSACVAGASQDQEPSFRCTLTVAGGAPIELTQKLDGFVKVYRVHFVGTESNEGHVVLKTLTNEQIVSAYDQALAETERFAKSSSGRMPIVSSVVGFAKSYALSNRVARVFQSAEARVYTLKNKPTYIKLSLKDSTRWGFDKEPNQFVGMRIQEGTSASFKVNYMMQDGSEAQSDARIACEQIN